MYECILTLCLAEVCTQAWNERNISFCEEGEWISGKKKNC